MPLKIFICYAHEDEFLQQGLEKQLRVLKRQGIIDVWHDREISAGSEWEREIDKQLNTADIILLLVSPDFMDSDYCYGVEMKRAMERHERGEALVIPVILRHVYWQGAPFGKLQALPKDAKPVRSWSDTEEAFFDIAEGIRKVVEILLARGAEAEQTRRVEAERTRESEVELAYKAIISKRHLRLDAAFLTDVGRKRKHNEDNLAYVIPKNPKVMANKGALFIVADGGARRLASEAGAIASEIAVDTVSNMYYQDDNDEVAGSLLYAIQNSNVSIYQRAVNLRNAMGTTCVVAVLQADMAYITNVGNSRAYLFRRGRVSQISQDHSWLAEQVRAGLLTEKAARANVYRDVVTRFLGIHSQVDVDVFRERLEENDLLVLCTDGLFGSVSDEDLLKIVEQSKPKESVYRLIEQANNQGGVDNISAIVVRVGELGG